MLTRCEYFKLRGQWAAPKNSESASISVTLNRKGSGGRGMLPRIRRAFAPVPDMSVEVRLGGAERGLAERFPSRNCEPFAGWIARPGRSERRTLSLAVLEKGISINDDVASWRHALWHRDYRGAQRSYAA